MGEGARPTFLILGAQKAGTNSLKLALQAHADVWIAKGEPQYFSLKMDLGPEWYERRLARGRGFRVRGEASPYYLFHPGVPARARVFDPGLKLIAVLRDPVERLISHYHHAVGRGFETLPLARALEAESARLAGEAERLRRDPAATSPAHQRHSYRTRGLYLEQLQRWTACFPREQLLVLEAGELQREPVRWLRACWEFLGVEPLEPCPPFPHVRRGNYALGDAAGVDRAALAEFYRGPNEALFAWWGRRAAWEGM